MSAIPLQRSAWLALLSRALRARGRLIVMTIWVAVVATGFVLLEWHSGTAGVAPPPAELKPASLKPAQAEGPQLIMFAHPRCACTRASLRQLERLLARTAELTDVRIVFLQSPTNDADWQDAPLVQQARNLSNVEVDWAAENELSASYGRLTSGHVLFYGPQGDLLFSGGLTNARGHEGPSAGTDAILAHLRGEAAENRAPVFGCSLSTPSP